MPQSPSLDAINDKNLVPKENERIAVRSYLSHGNCWSYNVVVAQRDFILRNLHINLLRNWPHGIDSLFTALKERRKKWFLILICVNFYRLTSSAINFWSLTLLRFQFQLRELINISTVCIYIWFQLVDIDISTLWIPVRILVLHFNQWLPQLQNSDIRRTWDWIFKFRSLTYIARMVTKRRVVELHMRAAKSILILILLMNNVGMRLPNCLSRARSITTTIESYPR